MGIADMKSWLFMNGRVTQSGWGQNSTKIKWEPNGNPTRFVESCFGGDRNKVYESLFENVKMALFNECQIIDGTYNDYQ